MKSMIGLVSVEKPENWVQNVEEFIFPINEYSEISIHHLKRMGVECAHPFPSESECICMQMTWNIFPA